MGYDKEMLLSAYEELVKYLVASETKLNLDVLEDYQIALHLASFSYLLNPTEDKDFLLKIMAASEDRILAFILYPEKGLDLTKEIKYPEPYLLLSNIIQNKGRADAIPKFLATYYGNLKGCSWQDSHIQNERNFCGYWSFELAVVVKQLKLEDVSFAGHMFYPRDLTGRILLPTWEDSPRGKAAQDELQRLRVEKDQKKITKEEELINDIDAKTHELIETVKELYQVKNRIKNSPDVPYSFVFSQIFNSLNKTLNFENESDQKDSIKKVLKKTAFGNELEQIFSKVNPSGDQEKINEN